MRRSRDMDEHVPEGWSINDDRITKLYTFTDFASAISFMVKVSFFCEKQDHHPEWKNIFNKVWVELTTHDEKHYTMKDVNLAKDMNEIFLKMQ